MVRSRNALLGERPTPFDGQVTVNLCSPPEALEVPREGGLAERADRDEVERAPVDPWVSPTRPPTIERPPRGPALPLGSGREASRLRRTRTTLRLPDPDRAQRAHHGSGRREREARPREAAS